MLNFKTCSWEEKKQKKKTNLRRVQTPTTLCQLIGVFKIRPVSAMAKLNNTVNSSSVYIMLDIKSEGLACTALN